MISEKVSNFSLDDLVDLKKFSSSQLQYWKKTDDILDYLLNVFILRKLHFESSGGDNFEE